MRSGLFFPLFAGRGLLCLFWAALAFGAGYYCGARSPFDIPGGGLSPGLLAGEEASPARGGPVAGTVTAPVTDADGPRRTALADAPPNAAHDAAQGSTVAGAHNNAPDMEAGKRNRPDAVADNKTAADAPGGQTQPPALAAASGGQFPALAAGPDTKGLPFDTASSPFILHKLGTGSGPTLLVVGGIQGDEPGGFSAAALLATHYEITSGSVWVVPNLNFPSILQRHRGLFGDLNRKFASLDANDPDYATVARIKSVLLDEQVTLILNLHDGSGFYRPTWEDSLRNPRRWGQSVIIDQEEMDAPRFSRLHETAGHVENEVNRALLDPGHRYHTYNTLTAAGNSEMAKTLSWFAVCNGKPAFGIEASKEFGTEHRTYYHLHVVEAFMRRMGIEFSRDFALTPAGVTRALNSGLKLTAFNNRLVFELDDARPVLSRVPFPKQAAADVRAAKPLLALVEDGKNGGWRVAYGNRTLTRISPEYMDFDHSLESLDLVVDGRERSARPGEVLSVRRSFLVKPRDGVRVNAIGAQREVNGTEAGVLLVKSDFMPRFSVDKSATTYRVELYKGKAFAGMLLVRFEDDAAAPQQAEKALTAREGKESVLGF